MGCIGLATALAMTFIVCTAKRQKPLSYKELEELGVNCPPYDTCNNDNNDTKPITDILKYRYCNCKAECAEYNTCCVDSPFVDLNRPIMPTPYRGTCKTLEHSDIRTFVVSHCGAEWEGDPTIKKLCEQPLSPYMVDPLSMIPITNIKSKLTYSNYFCAVCNEDDEDEYLKYWRILITTDNWVHVDGSDPEFWEKVFYNDEKNRWVVVVEDEEGKEQFNNLYLSYELPSEVSVAECVPELISDCRPSWTNDVVRQKCGTYMAVLTLRNQLEDGNVETKTYRNVHCAICNFAKFEKGKTCFRPMIPLGGGGGSFTILLDVNLADGDKVGEVNPCQKGEIFDSFFDRCRTLKCIIPGHVLSEGKCVKL